jgi:hypothetical protein
METIKKYFPKAFFLLFFLMLVVSFLNTIIRIQNTEIQRNIEFLKEKKDNLRVNYLSSSSLPNLSSSASQLKMIQANQVITYKIQTKKNKNELGKFFVDSFRSLKTEKFSERNLFAF